MTQFRDPYANWMYPTYFRVTVMHSVHKTHIQAIRGGELEFYELCLQLSHVKTLCGCSLPDSQRVCVFLTGTITSGLFTLGSSPLVAKLGYHQRRVAAISGVTINKDKMTDSHFPRFFGVVVQCEKRSKSSSLYNFWKYRYLKQGSFLNPNGFEFVIFLYIIYETFRSKQAEFTKLRVNLREIWRKFKCRKNRVRPPPWCDPSLLSLS